MKTDQHHRDEDNALLVPSPPPKPEAPHAAVTANSTRRDCSIRKVVEVLPNGRKRTIEKCLTFTI